MDNFSGLLHTAKNKIIILCSVKFPSETAGLLNDTASYHQKMADIIVGSQKIQIKIRFQMRLEMFRKVCCYLVLICVDHICLRVFFQCCCNLIKRIGSKQVIMIQKSHEIAFRHGKSCIGILCNAKILLQVLITDTPVHLCIRFQDCLHIPIFRASISQTQLPVLISLRKK